MGIPQMPTGTVNTNGNQHLHVNSKVRRISEWVDAVDHSYEPSEQGTCISSPTHSSHCEKVEFLNSVGDYLFPSTEKQNETRYMLAKKKNNRSANFDKYDKFGKTSSEHPSPLSQKGSLSGGINTTKGQQTNRTQTNSNTHGHSNVHTPFSPLSNKPTFLGVHSDQRDNRQKLPNVTANQVQSTEDMQLDNQLSFHGLGNSHCDSQDRTQLPDDGEIAMDIDNYEELQDQIKLEVHVHVRLVCLTVVALGY